MFTTTFALAALVAGAVAQNGFCPEAARFGYTKVTPTALSAGQTFTITSNFTCSYSSEYNIKPASVDYYVHNTVNNNGHEPPVLITRRTNKNVVDSFKATLPDYFWFPNASYSLETVLTYPVTGNDGTSQVLVSAGPGDVPLQITPNVNV